MARRTQRRRRVRRRALQREKRLKAAMRSAQMSDSDAAEICAQRRFVGAVYEVSEAIDQALVPAPESRGRVATDG